MQHQEILMGKIIDRFEENGLKSCCWQTHSLWMQAKAGGFYAEHKERPFFPNLVEYMISAPVFVQVLRRRKCSIKK